MDPRIVRPTVEREVEDELAFHVEMRVRTLMEEGWSEADARAEALRRLGDVERVKADCRDLGRGRDGKMMRRQWWDEIRSDVAYAWRQLRRAPAFTAAAVVTLAVAVGASTGVFGVVNAVLLRPLPFPEDESLSILWTRYLPPSGFDIDKFALSVPEFFDIQEGSRSFQHLGMFATGSRALTGDGDAAERVDVGRYSRDIFPALGVAPLHGRWFTADEDRADAAPVTVLGYELWRDRYGGDPTLVGRTILVNGEATEVVGVMPPGFSFPRGSAAYIPLGIDPASASEYGRGAHGWVGLGRRKPGVTQADVDAELAVFRERWAQDHEHNVAHYAWSRTLPAEVVGDAPRILAALMAAVGLILLIGCANVANLLLARGERRYAEVAVRTALGADRGRITRQLVTESLVLAVVGGVAGVGLAHLGTRALIAVNPEALPRLEEVTLGGPVLAFALGAALLTAVLFGVVPAVLTGRRGVATAASAASRAVGNRGRSGLRRALVAGEVALSLVVVILAGLMGRTMGALTGADPGLDTENLLAFDLTLPSASYPDDAQAPETMRRLLEGVQAVPGATVVTAGSGLPYGGSSSRWDFELDDRPPRQEGELARNAEVRLVLPGYFQALGIPVVAGRGFTGADGPDDALVGVVSETMARTYWPGESPLGKRWGYQRRDDQGELYVPWITVVGVVPDQVLSRVDADVIPQVYLPALQAGLSGYGWPRTYQVAVRTGVDAVGLVPEVRQAVAAFDPDLPLYQVTTMEDQVSAAYADTRMITNLLGLFALIAAILAAVGIYGVISYTVSGRTREIGVRVALGAARGQVTRMVVAEGAPPIVLGLVLGLVGAWFASRLVEAFLFGVTPADPMTFTLLPLGMVSVGFLASLVPALRASRIPPTEALREE
jgi:predicted permease